MEGDIEPCLSIGKMLSRRGHDIENTYFRHIFRIWSTWQLTIIGCHQKYFNLLGVLRENSEEQGRYLEKHNYKRLYSMKPWEARRYETSISRKRTLWRRRTLQNKLCIDQKL